MSLVHVQTMARYNRWMNQKVYDGCSGLADGDRKRDMGAFFKSIHGTLNHLLLADRIWMGRFTGETIAAKITTLLAQLGVDVGVTDLIGLKS